ncbi:MAG TPA: lysophospholipid acyltransferase family protein [Vicinamibacterales bacterium]
MIPPFHWWRTVFFLIPAIAVYSIVLGTLSIASSLFDRTGFFAHRCARAWSWLILRTTGVEVELHGLERLSPGTTYIFVSNHQSIYDIPIIFWNIPWQLRIIAKASLGKFPFLGWHLSRTGHLLVDRKKPDPLGILKRWKRLVTQGLSLIVFPEGTRSADGTVGRFKGGSFLLAIQAGLPIVPLSVSGSRHVMLKNRLMTCPGHVRLVVHDPIQTTDLEETAAGARDLAKRVREIVRADVDEPVR